MPAMMRRFHEAVQGGLDEVVVWGSGTPRREFLHVDDMAKASLFVMNLDRAIYDANTHPMLSHINVGTGTDVSIRELAEMLADITGFRGRLVFDATKPDGTPRKLMDVSRLAAMGWRARTGLREGIEATYRWFLENANGLRGA
jgi:nucleoside-diphosphate-sugar epimerase